MWVTAPRWRDGGVNPRDERQKQGLQLSFNRFLPVAFQGSRVTSNGGLILVREWKERLGFVKLVEQEIKKEISDKVYCCGVPGVFFSGVGVPYTASHFRIRRKFVCLALWFRSGWN